MKVMYKTLSVILFGLCLFNVGYAQDSYVSSPRRALTAPELLDAPDEWIERSLGWVDDILGSYQPHVTEHPVRRAALIRIDDILHIKSAPHKPLIQNFYHQRIAQAVEQIERTKVDKGMKVWKLYNHGFFIRTAKVSFCFDIMPGARAEGFPVDMSIMERIADQADAMFISHRHGDHADPQVVELFIDRGKPVIAPEGLWQTDESSERSEERTAQLKEITKHLIYPERSAEIIHEIQIQNGKETLKVAAYPGHQGTMTNNVHLVITPDNFTVVQTGDQSGSEEPGWDFDWIAQIGHQYNVDLFLPNCWSTNIKRFIRGVDPQLVITGHENEMGHTVDHREDYTQTYNRLFGTRYPFIVMTWGESYHYEKENVSWE
jgi:L-ascorbate metabolism protein UlaG (beta-lactamase superfamily)